MRLQRGGQRLAKLCVDPSRRTELQSICEDVCLNNLHTWLMLLLQQHCEQVDAALDKNGHEQGQRRSTYGRAALGPNLGPATWFERFFLNGFQVSTDLKS